MPVVERDEQGTPIVEENNLKTIHCVFDDFHSYLIFIQNKGVVKKYVTH